ncbi:hypothetical protein V2J09_002956 [Rumex salicifolius]
MDSAVKKGAFSVKKRKERRMGHTHHHHHHHHHHHIHQDNHQGDTKKEKKYRLKSYDELPAYMKDNEFIIKYYRSEWPLKQAFFSLFKWHNETLNVWTHLLGFLLFLGLTILIHTMTVSEVVDLFGIIFRPFPGAKQAALSQGSKQLFMETANAILNKNHTTAASPEQLLNLPLPSHLAPRWPFYIFLSGSMFCLLSSSVCHLFCCHSYHANTLLLRMDYVGITAMIITSFFPPIYYIFICERLWQIVYLSGISLFGLFTIVTLLSPALSSNKCRALRAMLFCCMGLFGLVPAIHASVVNWGNPGRSITLAYEAAMALSYLTGTAFYVSRVPERFKPGWFDLAGHSHQIFHVFVVFGAVAHFGAGLVFLQWRDMIGCDSSS